MKPNPTAADLRALPGMERLLADPRNAHARKALGGGRESLAVQAGSDGDVVRAASKLSAGRRRASKSGARAELLVVGAYHTKARESGLARMVKLPTPTKRIGPTGMPQVPRSYTAIYSAKSTVDCMGFTLRGRQRAILEECKAVTTRTRGGAFVPFQVREVEEHQREELDAAHAAGHIAVVTLVFGEGLAAQVYVVPWAWLKPRGSVHDVELRAAGFAVSERTYLVAQVMEGAA